MNFFLTNEALIPLLLFICVLCMVVIHIVSRIAAEWEIRHATKKLTQNFPLQHKTLTDTQKELIIAGLTEHEEGFSGKDPVSSEILRTVKNSLQTDILSENDLQKINSVISICAKEWQIDLIWDESCSHVSTKTLKTKDIAEIDTALRKCIDALFADEDGHLFRGETKYYSHALWSESQSFSVWVKTSNTYTSFMVRNAKGHIVCRISYEKSKGPQAAFGLNARWVKDTLLYLETIERLSVWDILSFD